MNRFVLVGALVFLMAGLSQAATGPPGLDLFVDVRMGNDLGSCRSAGNACRTIQAAVDRIPAVLTEDVVVHIAAGVYAEPILLIDRMAPRDHQIRLVGESQVSIVPPPGFEGNGITVRRAPRVVLENLGVEGFATGLLVRLSEVTVSNTRITGSTQIGIECEKGWVSLQAAGGGPGVSIVNDYSGIGITATCGCHVQFEGATWIAG
ncbi:MAG TPA: hypothetical protein VNL37_00740, partial [Candidatus Polarisedimenticolia bacterium]|nr:hypothetical protein [Candidatus Polarisedimenticolia bacterium]